MEAWEEHILRMFLIFVDRMLLINEICFLSVGNFLSIDSNVIQTAVKTV